MSIGDGTFLLLEFSVVCEPREGRLRDGFGGCVSVKLGGYCSSCVTATVFITTVVLPVWWRISIELLREIP